MNASRLASWISVPARWYLGVLFAGASWHKISAPHDFAIDVATYGILPLALVNLTAITLPWLELVTGALLLLGVRTRAAATLVFGMMLVFLVALISALARGLDMSCGCFASQGAQHDPISWVTAARDFFWLALSGFVLFFDRGFAGLEWAFERRRRSA